MNWHDRIKRARENNEFLEEDVHLAAMWPTCACGEQSPLIQRDALGVPVDKELARLGAVFYRAVRVDFLNRAAETLDQIEARAAILHERALRP